MFQEVLIPEGWGMREGVGKEWVGGDSFLNLGKAPFRDVCQSTLNWGLLWSWDGRRVSLSHERERPLPSLLHLIEVSMAMRDEKQKSSL